MGVLKIFPLAFASDLINFACGSGGINVFPAGGEVHPQSCLKYFHRIGQRLDEASFDR